MNTIRLSAEIDEVFIDHGEHTIQWLEAKGAELCAQFRRMFFLPKTTFVLVAEDGQDGPNYIEFELFTEHEIWRASGQEIAAQHEAIVEFFQAHTIFKVVQS